MKLPATLVVLLERLGSFAAVLESPGFVAAEFVRPESEPGVWTMAYPRDHPEVDRFVALAYGEGLVRTDLEWFAWRETPEARTLRDDSEALASATPEPLAKLIPVVVRQERFNEGALKWARGRIGVWDRSAGGRVGGRGQAFTTPTCQQGGPPLAGSLPDWCVPTRAGAPVFFALAISRFSLPKRGFSEGRNRSERSHRRNSNRRCPMECERARSMATCLHSLGAIEVVRAASRKPAYTHPHKQHALSGAFTG